MRGWMLAALALAMVIGCTPTPPPSTPATAPQKAARPAPATIMGEWRLVSLTGQSLDKQPSIHAVVGAAFIDAFSQCVPFRFAGNAGGAPPLWKDWAPPGGVAMCARGWSLLEDAFAAFIPTVTQQTLDATGRLVMTGPTGEAVFERVTGAGRGVTDSTRSAPKEAGFWGLWRVTAINGAAPPADKPIIMALGMERAEAYSGCVAQFYLAPYLDDTSRLFSHWETGVPVCDIGRSAEENALEKALNGKVVVAPDGADAMTLTSAGGTVRLERGG